jgi:hypothetical protein
MSRLAPLAPWTGFACVAFFIASIAVSANTSNGNTDAAWIANYTGFANRFGHTATGACLVFFALSLLIFLVHLHSRVQTLRPFSSLLPLAAAGAGAACIAAGGVVIGSISNSLLTTPGEPTPGADLLRQFDSLGLFLVAWAGMSLVALAVATLSWQAHQAHFFGRWLTILGFLTLLALLNAAPFVPIIILLVWAVIVAVKLLRTPAAAPVA